MFWILVFWLLVTGVGVFFCARMTDEAYKDLQFVRASGRNGRYEATALEVFRQTVAFLLMQVAGFLVGIAMFTVEARRVRGWIFLAMIIFWSVALSITAYRNLCYRRDQRNENRDRSHGHLKTRKDDHHG